jgi:FdhD protein
VINSEVSFDVIISPGDIKEFVFGNLFAENFIQTKDDVLAYKEKIKESLFTVNVKIKDFENKKIYLKKNYNIVWTECGSGGEITRFSDQFKPISSKIKLKGEDILVIPNKIKDKITLFKETGAFHYAFLFNHNLELITYTYDIGRHNAVDKILGQLMLTEQNSEDKVLYITGRISSDIVLKCLRAKIPVIISRGAPLEMAIRFAEKYNICLIGFLRGRRFNVYSNSEIIKTK